jgi:hypothetical protein
MAILTLHLAKSSILGGRGEECFRASQKLQGDQKVSMHLMITVQKASKNI